MSKIDYKIDMTSLKSFSLNTTAFQSANSFNLTQLESLESIDIGVNCFNGTSSFSITSVND